MSAPATLLATLTVFVLLGGMGCLTRADAKVALRIEIDNRQVNRTHPTGQNNIVTLACLRGDPDRGSLRRFATPRYFVENPLTGREREMTEFSLQRSGLLTFTLTPELEGAFSCGDSTLSAELRSDTLSLVGEFTRGRADGEVQETKLASDNIVV